MQSDVDVGNRIRALRVERGWTQPELAEKLTDILGVQAQKTLSRIELGQRPVRLLEAAAIAEVLGVELGLLLPDGGGLAALAQTARRALALARQERAQADSRVRACLDRVALLELCRELSHGGTGPYMVNGGPDVLLEVTGPGGDPLAVLALLGLEPEQIAAIRDETGALRVGDRFLDTHTDGGESEPTAPMRARLAAIALLERHFPYVLFLPRPGAAMVEGLRGGEGDDAGATGGDGV